MVSQKDPENRSHHHNPVFSTQEQFHPREHLAISGDVLNRHY